LEKYVESFERASEDMFELHAVRTDEEVDSIITAVVRSNRLEIPNADRCRIWKAIRYLWFTSPAASKEYIDPAEVPRLVLPKHEFRARDQRYDIKTLDPDRQRMVVRKSVFEEEKGTVLVQEEVYKRDSHLGETLKGLQRSMEFWMNQDARKMAREDPREEALISQLKSLELEIAFEIDKMRLLRKTKRIISFFFLLVKFAFLSAATLFLAVAIIDAPSTSLPSLTRFLSASYLRLSIILFTTFMIILETTRSKRSSPRFEATQAMHAKCRLLHSDMVSFRLKTHYVRQTQLLRYLDDSNVALTGEAAEAAAVLTSTYKEKKHTMSPGPVGAFENYMDALLGTSSPDIRRFSSIDSKSKPLGKSLQSLDRKALPLMLGDRFAPDKSSSRSLNSDEEENASSRLSLIINAVDSGLLTQTRKGSKQWSLEEEKLKRSRNTQFRSDPKLGEEKDSDDED